MNGSSHFVLGCGTGLLVIGVARSLGLAAPSDTLVLTGVVLAGVGALGPDVDCQGSTINRTAPLLLLTGIAILGLIPGLSVTLLPQFTGSTWLTFLHGQFPLATVQELAGWHLVGLALALVIAPHTMAHRGPTHSLAFTIIVTIAVMAAYFVSGLPLLFGLSFGAGWASHLIADAWTDVGLPGWDWLLPSWWTSN